MTTTRVDAVVMTAIGLEASAFLEHVQDRGERVHKGTVYEVGKLGEWNVAVVEIGAGNQRAAQEAERALGYFEPQVLAFVGVAGGIKDVALGDVVVATKVYGYESGKDGLTFATRPDVGETSHAFEQRARAARRTGDWISRLPEGVARPRLFVGALAAGEKVVADVRSQTAKMLQQQYGDALAVEMEGRGVLVAARADGKVQTLIVRGISDLLSGKGAADASGSQPIAARNAAAVAAHLIERVLRDGFNQKEHAPKSPPAPPDVANAHRQAEASSTNQTLAVRPLIQLAAEATLAPNRVRLSPDGSHIAVWRSRSSADSSAILWNRRTGTPGVALVTTDTHGYGFGEVSWAQDGTAIVSTRDQAYLWSAKLGLRKCASALACIYDNVSIAANGERAVWGSVFGAATLVNVATAADVHSAMLHDPAASYGLDFAWSDGALIVASDYGSVQVWDSTNGHHVATILQSGAGELALCSTSDGKSVAIATGAGLLAIADASSGWRPRHLVEAQESEEASGRPQVAATNSHFGLLSNGTVRVMSESGVTLFSQALANRWTSPSGRTMAFSRGGQQFAFFNGTTLTVLTLSAEHARLNWSREYLEAAEPSILGWGIDDRLWLLVGRHTIVIASRADETVLHADGAIDDATMSADGQTVALAMLGLTLIDTTTAAVTSVRFLVTEGLAVAQVDDKPAVLAVPSRSPSV